METVRTNRYGLAKGGEFSTVLPGGDDVELRFEARDDSGRTGHETQWVTSNSVKWRLGTDKILYSRGDPIQLSLTSTTSTYAEMTAVVFWRTAGRPIGLEVVRVRDRRSQIALPYTEDFRGPVSITIYDLNDAYGANHWRLQRTVLYPDPGRFGLEVKPARPDYSPGEEAQVDLVLSDSNARRLEGVLGIVAFDIALEERVRSGGEFESDSGNRTTGFQWTTDTPELSGVTPQDLQNLDLSRPASKDLELLAEMLLQPYSLGVDLEQSNTSGSVHSAFDKLIERQLSPIEGALDLSYRQRGTYPKDREALERVLAEFQLDLDKMKDPWGTPYRAAFRIAGPFEVVDVISAGPDKRLDSGDDLEGISVRRSYFDPIGLAIRRAAAEYHRRTGGFIRDVATLRDELRSTSVFNLDNLRDPWGTPYQFDFRIEETYHVIETRSAGPDKHLDEPGHYPTDDVRLGRSLIDYFGKARARIDNALKDSFQATGQFASSEDVFYEVMHQAGIETGDLRDQWDRPFYLTFTTESAYGDSAVVRNYATYHQRPTTRTEITPVSRQISYVYLRSTGPDRTEGTPDDFTIATFSRALSEQPRSAERPATGTLATIFTGVTGAIGGQVADSTGAFVPGVEIVATRDGTTEVYKAASDDSGHYLFRNLPVGFYEVKASVPGFRQGVFIEVPVTASNLTELDFQLEVGQIAESVTVSAGVGGTAAVQTASSNEMSLTLSLPGKPPGTASLEKIPVSTPRLREYFPETLVWKPELLTDKHGRASLRFKLADNITTWKVSAIGSTRDGRVATAEALIRAFQPFFVEFDPPKILTKGDELELPVVVRNYLDDPQKVDLTIRPDSWFELPGGERFSTTVKSQQATRTTFAVRAVRAVVDGKQRVTAQSAKAGDAVEKTVTVRPNGREVVETSLVLLPESRRFDLQIPATAISDSISARLKIYPNLWAHLADSIDGIVQRPYGCAEQIVSSGYASLVALRAAASPNPEFSAKARRYVQAAYDQLPAHQVLTGGFGYWHGSAPDLALTAHALKFLHGAQKVISVDGGLIGRAQTWIFSQQQGDGSWPARLDPEETNKRRSVLVTAYVARVVAPLASTPVEKDSLARALAYLSGRIGEVDEPYVIACYALAALDAGQKDESRRALERLAGLARIEGATRYWMLETNSPFYGWGTAGRVETTALVVEALARGAELVPSLRQLTEQGLLFLMRNKDRHGVWHSTQATVNVLNAIVSVLAQQRVGNLGGRIEVLVDGRSVSSLQLPATEQLAVPLAVDLSRFLSQGAHAIELRGADTTAIGQLVSSWYVPWSEAAANEEGQGSLRLEVEFDRASAKVQDAIECRVRAERVGFRGYGMMLAEIGLPPGVEVDRGTLDDAVKASGWELHRYDVLPDRVVAYLWPRDGVTTFSFKFRARMGLKAQTAPSLLYDYYNPDARVVVRPQVFQIVE